MVFVSSFSLPRESNFSSYLFLILVFNICVQNLFKNGEIGSMECTARIKIGRKCYHVVCCKNGELFLSKFLLLRSIASNCLNWRWYSIDARRACYKVVQRFPLYVTVPWDILGLPATWQACGTSLKILIRRLSAVNRTAAQISQAPKPASLVILTAIFRLGLASKPGSKWLGGSMLIMFCSISTSSSTNGIVSPAILGDVGVVSHSRTLAIVVHTRKGSDWGNQVYPTCSFHLLLCQQGGEGQEALNRGFRMLYEERARTIPEPFSTGWLVRLRGLLCPLVLPGRGCVLPVAFCLFPSQTITLHSKPAMRLSSLSSWHCPCCFPFLTPPAWDPDVAPLLLWCPGLLLACSRCAIWEAARLAFGSLLPCWCGLL